MKNRYSIFQIIGASFLMVLITFGVHKFYTDKKINSLQEEVIQAKEEFGKCVELAKENYEKGKEQEKEKLLEKERSKKLEEQLKKCCPSYSVEE